MSKNVLGTGKTSKLEHGLLEHADKVKGKSKKEGAEIMSGLLGFTVTTSNIQNLCEHFPAIRALFPERPKKNDKIIYVDDGVSEMRSKITDVESKQSIEGQRLDFIYKELGIAPDAYKNK